MVVISARLLTRSHVPSVLMAIGSVREGVMRVRRIVPSARRLIRFLVPSALLGIGCQEGIAIPLRLMFKISDFANFSYFESIN